MISPGLLTIETKNPIKPAVPHAINVPGPRIARDIMQITPVIGLFANAV